VDETADLPRYLQLLWGAEPEGRRGPRPGQTIGGIGDAAVAIADELGLDAVSMKAVAGRLGMTTMSLYRYVDAKEELYAVMMDRGYGPPPAGLATRGGWRTRLEAWGRGIAAGLVAHPWMVQVPVTSPPVTPNVLAWTERGLLALEPSPLTEQEKLSSMLVVDGYVRQHVSQSVVMGFVGSAAAAPSPAWPVLAVADPARFPLLRTAAPAIEDDDGDFFAEELTFGLGLILDGVAALVARRS
jgi:AcrR family transcriptional regulator